MVGREVWAFFELAFVDVVYYHVGEEGAEETGEAGVAEVG